MPVGKAYPENSRSLVLGSVNRIRNKEIPDSFVSKILSRARLGRVRYTIKPKVACPFCHRINGVCGPCCDSPPKIINDSGKNMYKWVFSEH